MNVQTGRTASTLGRAAAGALATAARVLTHVRDEGAHRICSGGGGTRAGGHESARGGRVRLVGRRSGGKRVAREGRALTGVARCGGGALCTDRAGMLVLLLLLANGSAAASTRR